MFTSSTDQKNALIGMLAESKFSGARQTRHAVVIDVLYEYLKAGHAIQGTQVSGSQVHGKKACERPFG